jgi:acyl-lipid omega-6 desaturase (Delta-12 desaturase)
MTAFGWLTLNPPSIWKASHDHHHKWNAKTWGEGIGAFPTIRVQDYQAAPKALQMGYRFARSPLAIALGYFTVFLGLTCIRSFAQNPRKHWDSAGAIVLQIAIGVALWLYLPGAFWFAFAIPLVLAGGIGTYLFYAQHSYPGVKLGQEPWDYVTAALESSSYMKLSPLLHWLTGNIGYHHVHHLNHRIPFYRLPEAMKALPELQRPGVTSLSVRDIRACLRLKLWDPAKGKLVGWNGK